jgi:hypothetical protein
MNLLYNGCRFSPPREHVLCRLLLSLVRKLRSGGRQRSNAASLIAVQTHFTRGEVHISFPKMCAAVLFAALVSATIPAAHATCTNASLTGVYGVIFNGLNGQGQPTTSVAQVTSDGAGKLIGSVTQTTEGTINSGTFSGTYTVAKNCTGSLTVSFDKPGVYNFALDNGNEGFYLINTDSGKTRGGYGVAQGVATCTDIGVKHTYAFQGAGILVGTGDVVSMGQIVLTEPEK